MEIVTAARRDVRQVIMEARRELLVLSAQVQAALGEVNGKGDPASLLGRGSVPPPPGLPASGSSEPRVENLVPESAVKTMLDEARADMEALAEDAKTVPFQSTPLASSPAADHTPVFPRAVPDAALPKPLDAALTSFDATHFPGSRDQQPKDNFPAEVTSSLLIDQGNSFIDEDRDDAGGDEDHRPYERPAPISFESIASLTTPPSSTVASRVLLSSPFPSDAVAVPQGRSLRAFVALFVVVGAVVFSGSYWWLRGRAAGANEEHARAAEPAPKSGAASNAAAAPIPPPPAAPTAPAKDVKPSRLSVVVQARRQSWIRTTVDGESDLGRTYAAGETLQLNADRGITLRVGDAGAVFVSVNKAQAIPLGRDGQVMTKQFVPETRPPASASVVPAAAGPTPGKQPVTPSNSIATASGSPIVPVPLVQPAQAAAKNVPIEQNPVATIARNEPATVPFPRSEPATVPPSAPGLAPAGAANVSPANAVVQAARQWLDAYHRQERSAMAALSTDNLQLADERRTDERFPAGMEVNRSLDRVSVQIAADTAVLTAVMTERGDSGTRVSPISQVWVLSGGQWRVRQVRLVSEARLNQIFR
jgi:hypothetical protein